MNALGGENDNALQAASLGRHEKVVQILLDAGADFNAQGGELGDALQAALYRGHEKVTLSDSFSADKDFPYIVL